MVSHTQNTKDWYDVSIVVELLIHETPRGEKYAPEISNLCIGFTSLSLEKLGEEIDDMRAYWPAVFPREVSTNDLLKLVQSKYKGYKEILALRDRD
jgi:hypothetical protein